MVDRRLIIFIKNPELGTAKTRLAKTIGPEKALAVYLRLLAHTRSVVMETQADRKVYYSKFADETDEWTRPLFSKGVQKGADLGDKMLHAFQDSADEGFQKLVIIGSDCILLRPHHLEEAFAALETNEYVIGPAEDGGYYLLGMQIPTPELFREMEWSTEQVFPETLRRIEAKEGKVHLLETLSDVDYEEDLVEELRQVIE